MFEKGQKVKHPKINGEMTVVGLGPLGSVATKSGVLSRTSNDMIQCDFTHNGKVGRRSFRNSELTPVDTKTSGSDGDGEHE